MMTKPKLQIRLIAMLLLILSFSILSRAETPEQHSKPISRKILALYSLKENYDDLFFSSMHQGAEMPLNHLGFIVNYQDIESPLPDPSSLEGYRAVVTWFEAADTAKHVANYCDWLNQILDRDIKLIILGRFGFEQEAHAFVTGSCARVLKRIGIEYQGNFTDNPLVFDIIKRNSEMVEYERKLLLSENIEYEQIGLASPDTNSFVTLRRQDIENSESHPVTISPHGGYVHSSFLLYVRKDINQHQWRLNPFLYFSKILNTEQLPKPDTTTRYGRRIYFSHLDGDGIFNVSHIDRKSYSGEIILNDIIRKYPSLPVTVSLITGYFDIPEFHGKRALEMYKNIFSASNVQAAAHGYAHPLIWKKQTVALKVPNYKYSAEKETIGSVNMMQKMLAQQGILKPVNLYLWTGDCIPGEMDVQYLDQKKILNMNGGDSRFDKRFYSHSYLYPLTLQRGKTRQYYSPNANENIYTNHWQGPFHTFRLVMETFINTEVPQRLKPINLYYHIFNGEHLASMKVLNEIHDYINSQDIFAITAAEYPPLLKDFYEMKISEISPNIYDITNSGHLQTIRFDHPATIDLAKSKGVLGYKIVNQTTYVHLDQSAQHRIFVSASSSNAPYIEESSFEISNLQLTSSNASFEKQGWHKPFLRLMKMQASTAFSVYLDDELEQTVISDAKGTLEISFRNHDKANQKQNVIIRTDTDKL